MMEITQKDIQLLSFLKRYKIISLKDSNKIYNSEWYHYKRLKQLEDERYLKKINRFQIKLDVRGTKFLKDIGYDYNYVCRKQEYIDRLNYISKIAALTINNDIEFMPSWEIKDKMIFTDKARRYVGELHYKQKKYLAYYIEKNKKVVYISQIINDIQKAVDYECIILFIENFKIVNKNREFFMSGKENTLIVNPKESNLEIMRLLLNIDVYDVIEKIYKGKEILLSDWLKADFMTEDRQYIIFMPFLDAEKLHRLNIFYKDNKEVNRKIDILTLKENVKKINDILTNRTKIIEIDDLLGGIDGNMEKT